MESKKRLDWIWIGSIAVVFVIFLSLLGLPYAREIATFGTGVVVIAVLIRWARKRFFSRAPSRGQDESGRAREDH